MGGFLDKLLVTSQQTGASIASLASEMYRYGSPLRQVGFSVNETMATLGAFEKAGVNTKLVMGSLRIALGKMAKAGEKDLPAGLAKGIAAIKSAKTGGEAAAKAIELFGARAGPGHGRRDPRGPLRGRGPHQAAGALQGRRREDRRGHAAVLRQDGPPAQQGGARRQPASACCCCRTSRSWSASARASSPGCGAWTTRSRRKCILAVGLAVAAMGPALVVIGKVTSGIGRMVGVVGKLTLAFGKGGKAAPAWARGIAAVTKGLAVVRQAGGARDRQHRPPGRRLGRQRRPRRSPRRPRRWRTRRRPRRPPPRSGSSTPR